MLASQVSQQGSEMTSSVSTLGIVSLRRPFGRVPAGAERVHSERSSFSVGLSVTLMRAPLAALGVLWVIAGDSGLAVSAFCLFAGIDVVDGLVARSRHEETAARRIADVVIDRVAIQSAVVAVSVMSGFPLWVPLTMVLRDVTQALYSAWFITRYRTVVVGPRLHMAYGLTMLAWGASVIVTSEISLWPTLITMTISLIILLDYVMRCRALGRMLELDRR